MTPAEYVQVLPVPSYRDQIPPDVEGATLASGSYPSIILAFNAIRADSGGPSWPPEEAPWVPARWQPFLGRIELAIAALSRKNPAPEDHEGKARQVDGSFCYLDTEFYSFCTGEHTLATVIATRSKELTLAGFLLADFFEGWTYFDDHNFDPEIPF